MGNTLKAKLRERLDYLDQATRERVIADALAALDRPTLLMVDEGRRRLVDMGYPFAGRRYGPEAPGASEIAEEVFERMVDAGRRGA